MVPHVSTASLHGHHPHMNEPRNSTVHVAEEKIAGKGDMHKVKSQGITEATFRVTR